MFNLIILGSRDRTKTLGAGQFYCPRCRARQPYEHKQSARYFAVYFIPLFPIGKQTEFIECQACHAAFELSVLNQTGPVLPGGPSALLKGGRAVQTVVAGLLQAGASREDAAWVVYAAARGQFAVCENCQLMYDHALVYCGQCGHKLAPYQGPPDVPAP